MKALIVDDHSFARSGLMSLIDWKSMGFDSVLEADDGEAALQIALNNSPDLVITDVKMPVMDGIELTRRLRETIVDTYIIMLSAYDEWEFARAAMQYNVSDYIIKPLTEENIRQLSQKIEYIVADSIRKKSYRSAILNSKHIEEYILAALKDQSTSKISHLFEHKLPDMNLRPNDAKDCCIILVNLLFNYLRKMEYPYPKLDENEIEAIDYVNFLKNVSQLYSYTYQLYLDFLQFTSRKVDGAKVYAEQIKKHIINHYAEDSLSVESIAAELHLTPAYVGSIFKQYENINIISYINDYRIKKASEILSDNTLTVSQVGRKVGIPDPNYFTRLFKRSKGITPTEFRSILFMDI